MTDGGDAIEGRPELGYIYVEMMIHDPERLKQYTAPSAPAMKAAGRRYIVLGRSECLERRCTTDRTALVEFDTAGAARSFYHSTAYQAARENRLGATKFRMVLLEAMATTP